MPTPTSAITRFDLGSTFSEFDLKMAKMNYIGAKVLKPRPVGVVAANIGRLPIDQLIANSNRTTARNAGGGYARDNFTFGTWGYACKEYGKEQPLDDSQLAMYGDIFDAEAISIDKAEDDVLNEYERKVAALVMNTTTFAGHTGGGSTAWTNHASSTVYADVIGAVKNATDGSALAPNALILSWDKYLDMIQSQDLLDRIRFTERATTGTMMAVLPDMFALKYILVGKGYVNNANEGQATAIQPIWSSSMALVARIAETDNPQEPCIGRTFIWTADGGVVPAGDSGPLAVTAEEYREEGVRGAVYRARTWYDLQMMYAPAGYLLTGL